MSQPTALLRPARSTGLGFILLAAVLWGTIAVTVSGLYRLALLAPVSIGFYRVAFAVPALVLLSLVTRQYQGFQFTRPFLLRSGLMGFALASDQICNFTAIQLVGVSTASLVSLCTAPLLVAVFGALVWREALPPRVYGLLGAALIGTALLVYHPQSSDSAVPISGVVWALGSATSYATILLCSRSLSTMAPPLVSLATSFSFAAVLLLPLAVHTGLVLVLSWQAWSLLVYLGVIATGMAYLLFLLGMRRTPVTIASVVTLLEPFLAVVLAFFLFGEKLTRLGVFGGSLLLLSLGLLPFMLNAGGSQHGYSPEIDR